MIAIHGQFYRHWRHARCAMFAGMLSSYKVLDLADQQGMFCGYVLAHLGAEVVAVEPPGGNSARARAPFAGDGNGPDSGLWWQAYGRGKSSLVLDLESGPGHRVVGQPSPAWRRSVDTWSPETSATTPRSSAFTVRFRRAAAMIVA